MLETRYTFKPSITFLRELKKFYMYNNFIENLYNVLQECVYSENSKLLKKKYFKDVNFCMSKQITF